jgi:GNAT superfamily N-acetyltransferase
MSRVTIEWFDGPRRALADLFALADDSSAAVAQYRELGRVLVARDGEQVVGHAQLVASPDGGTAELKSLAVQLARQREGIGRLLVRRAIEACRDDGLRCIVVATAAADTDILRFYQQLGFRMARVERDVFTAEHGYPAVSIRGVPLRDQVWLSLDLDALRATP